ncbi:MAG: hypothetical protein WDN03_09340 [Rhizomicrobium sp.]
MYGFNHRHHASVAKMKEMIDAGQYGKVIWIRGRYGKSVDEAYLKSWRAKKDLAGGGILIDQGNPHARPVPASDRQDLRRDPCLRLEPLLEHARHRRQRLRPAARQGVWAGDIVSLHDDPVAPSVLAGSVHWSAATLCSMG